MAARLILANCIEVQMAIKVMLISQMDIMSMVLTGMGMTVRDTTAMDTIRVGIHGMAMTAWGTIGMASIERDMIERGRTVPVHAAPLIWPALKVCSLTIRIC